MKNQANILLPRKTNKATLTDPKEMEIYKQSDKEFRITLLRSLLNYKNTQTDN